MILEVVLFLLSIPAGFLIAYFARDELIQGRKYFKIIIILSIISAVYFFLTKTQEIAFSSLFVTIISYIGYHKSFDKKWTKKN